MDSFDVKAIPLQLLAFFASGAAVGAGSDILLNDASKFKQSGEIVGALRPYFESRPIVVASASAGATVALAMALASMLFWLASGSLYPRTVVELLIYTAIAYPVGFALDYAIYKSKVFGEELDAYYEKAGAGHWGALALLVAVVPSFFVSRGVGEFSSDIQSAMMKATRMAAQV